MNQSVQPNSDQVLKMIDRIASVSSKNEKERLIAEFWPKSAIFKFAVRNALDPFVTFGIAKIPKTNSEGVLPFTTNTIDMLRKMEHRELTGNAAIDALRDELETLSPDSGELLKRIITGKLKAGFSESSVNRAVPGAIFTFKAMLSHKLSDRIGKKDFDLPIHRGEPLRKPWYAELKEDGVRGFGRSSSGGTFCSRTGKPLNAGIGLEAEVMQLFSLWSAHFSGFNVPLVIDGELDDISGEFNETVGSVHRKEGSKTMGLKVIDVIRESELEAGLCPLPYRVRRGMLEQFFEAYGSQFSRIDLIKRWEIHSVDEAKELFEKLHDAGEEGVIVKHPDGLWEGKRSTAWLKIKGEESVDLVIKRLEPAEKGSAFGGIMGAAVCDYINSRGETVEVSVGGGWSIDQRGQFWADHIGRPCQYRTVKGNELSITTYEPKSESIVGQLIEVFYHEETKDGSLRHPRYKRFRHDKPISDGQGV